MVRLAVLAVLFLSSLAHAAAPPPPRIAGRAWIVGDLTSGQVLVAEKADERMEPASLTKLMTAYLVFSALRDKKLALEQPVPVSAHAWRAPGSRMFLVKQGHHSIVCQLDLKGYLLCVLVVVVVASLCMITSRLGVIRVLKSYA